MKKYICCVLLLIAATPVLAYKTQRVCETTEASLKAPAKKTCKTVLVMTEAQKKQLKKKKLVEKRNLQKKKHPNIKEI
jgi:hypothetical protein